MSFPAPRCVPSLTGVASPDENDRPSLSHVLVTGATGFVGAQVVDLLLERGIKVTGTARSQSKANQVKTRREKYGDLFSMAITGDLAAPDVFDEVVKDVDVVIHVASVSLPSPHAHSTIQWLTWCRVAPPRRPRVQEF